MYFPLALGTLPELAQNLETLELGLNIAGYIPVVSTISGRARDLLAVAELVAGLAVGVFGALSWIGGNPAGPALAILSVKLLVHAYLNDVRSGCEIQPFTSLFTCLPYDLVQTFYLQGRYFRYI